MCSVSYSQKIPKVFSLLKAVVTEFKAQDENRIVWNRVSSGERTVRFGSRGLSRWVNCLATAAWSKLSTQFEQVRIDPKNEGENDLVTAAIMHFFFSFAHLEKSFGRNFLTERTENLYVILFQINSLAELKIRSTSSIRYLMMAQKMFCAEWGLSFCWNKTNCFNRVHVNMSKWTSNSRRLK